MPKERLDTLLVARGLAHTREFARRIIRAGQVTVAGQRAEKPGHKHDIESEIEIKALPKYVSRGGDKLERAFEVFDFPVEGLDAIDIGASTGGFTDCLLQHGAARVIAVDVGAGQLHWKLRNDSRVVVMENVNARYLIGKDLPFVPSVATIDVAFISLTKVMPAVIQVLSDQAQLVTLIKPQFEAGRELVESGGVVRDPAVREAVVDRIRNFGEKDLGLTCKDVCESPLKGPAGNKEYLAFWRKNDK